MSDEEKQLLGLYLVDNAIEFQKTKESLKKATDEKERNFKWYLDTKKELEEIQENEEIKKLVEQLKNK